MKAAATNFLINGEMHLPYPGIGFQGNVEFYTVV